MDDVFSCFGVNLLNSQSGAVKLIFYIFIGVGDKIETSILFQARFPVANIPVIINDLAVARVQHAPGNQSFGKLPVDGSGFACHGCHIIQGNPIVGNRPVPVIIGFIVHIVHGPCILADRTIMVIGCHCVILAVLCAVRLQAILKYLKISVIVMGFDYMNFLVEPDQVALRQFFRRQFGIVKVFG